MIAKNLLALALLLKPFHMDGETAEERESRYETIAVATEGAVEHVTCTGMWAVPECTPKWKGKPERLAVLMLSQAYLESGLARHVHEGRCRVKIGECDHGRARSPWQLQYTELVGEDWWQMRGSDQRATSIAAIGAATVLSVGLNGCRTLEGAISMYATGKSCRWAGAEPRVRFHEKLWAKYRELEQSPQG